MDGKLSSRYCQPIGVCPSISFFADVLLELAGPLRSKWQSTPGQSSEERWGDLLYVMGELRKENNPHFVSPAFVLLVFADGL